MDLEIDEVPIPGGEIAALVAIAVGIAIFVRPGGLVRDVALDQSAVVRTRADSSTRARTAGVR